MRKIILFASLLGLGNCLNAQNFEWAGTAGSTGTDIGKSIAVNAAGAVYTVGHFDLTVDFNPGPSSFNRTSMGGADIFMQKLDATGGLEWILTFGSSVNDAAYGVTLDASGNVLVTGYFQGTVDFDSGAGTWNLTSGGALDIFIAKYDPNGNLIWATKVGGTGNDIGVAITTDATSNIYVTGYFNGSVDFDPGVAANIKTSAGLTDIFVLKLDSSGNHVWAAHMGGTADEQGNAITVDASGNVFTTGFFSGVADFNPSASTSNLSSAGGTDVFISCLNSAGAYSWGRQVGGSFDDKGNGIAYDSVSGNIFYGGFFQGTADLSPSPAVIDNYSSNGLADIFISKINAIGNLNWVQPMGGSGNDKLAGLCVDNFGRVYSTGSFEITVDFDPNSGSHVLSAGGSDIYINKLDGSGFYEWAVSLSSLSAGTHSGTSICLGASNSVHTTGYFQNAVDFDQNASTTFALASGGGNDMFVHKMNFLSTGIDNQKMESSILAVYPNPAVNEIFVQSENRTSISIVNMLGQEVFQKEIQNSEVVDISGLKSGIYFVQDLNSGRSLKFIKQ